ncbi:unnamed protein product, partial [Phaeothamnion confervicola]
GGAGDGCGGKGGGADGGSSSCSSSSEDGSSQNAMARDEDDSPPRKTGAVVGLEMMPPPSPQAPPPDPQAGRPHSSRLAVWATSAATAALGMWYLRWRRYSTLLPPGQLMVGEADFTSLYWWCFFLAECLLLGGVLMGQFQRFFPLRRAVVCMGDMAQRDPGLAGKATVAVLLPTAGEPLAVVFKALLGATSQRLWEASSALPVSQQLRVVVMDESARREVILLAAGVARLAWLLQRPVVRALLAKEGVGDVLFDPAGEEAAAAAEAAASRPTPLAFYA